MSTPTPVSDPPTKPPRISILMATYNGAAFVRQSISSLLAQTCRDFELIVVDDCSTDATPAILASIDDPRLKVFRNERNAGVVASRNRCLALASGEYIAMQDHDDLSRPTRLARQCAFLDRNPGVVLVATAAHFLADGTIKPPRHPLRSSPALIAWLLLVANPLVCSSIMFRADAARRLDGFMRADYTYADDFDLYHRLMAEGRIARLDEPLVIYRQHEAMTSRTHEDVMMANAERVLVPSYRAWFGEEAQAVAELVVRHVAAVRVVPDLPTLRALQRRLRDLTAGFFASQDVSDADRTMILDHAEDVWARVVRDARRLARVPIGPAEAWLHLPPARSTARSMGTALAYLPFASRARRMGRSLLDIRPRPAKPLPRMLQGNRLNPVPPEPGQAPTLFVVVDTEAEFDWSGPMGREHANVAAIQQIERGQAVFDRYGLRPVYVVDYPVASNPDSVARLRAILDRHGCEIGAHLHPWTTPPFEEDLSNRNSFPGNLPPELEREKLGNLVALIERSFGVRPLFYKAGRYGFGQHTARTLSGLGIRVDFSILPGADLTWRHGPDFTGLAATPYWLDEPTLVAAPMTRSTVGLLPILGRRGDQLGKLRLGRKLPIRSLLARSRIADTITLTPEGVTTAEQIRLIRALLARGQRQFILHYHSPSLAAGNTSYTPDEAAVARLVASLSDVCAFFFETVGGMPGYPRDLIPVAPAVPSA